MASEPLNPAIAAAQRRTTAALLKAQLAASKISTQTYVEQMAKLVKEAGLER